MKKCILSVLLVHLACLLPAQELSLSSNLLDWANLGTVNLQVGCSFSRHLSLHAGGRYNNWNYGSVERGNPFQNRARTAWLGVRYWPWNVYSSWWFGARAQVEEYNRGGLLRQPTTEEGSAVGAGFSLGYNRMLSKHWNLDFGLGVWAGRAWYTQYRCPRCGRVLQANETKWFILPSNATQISIVYVF